MRREPSVVFDYVLKSECQKTGRSFLISFKIMGEMEQNFGGKAMKNGARMRCFARSQFD